MGVQRRLTYRHTNHHIHVRGYKEEGPTTTPLDMLVLNDVDRFHLVIDVIDRVPGLARRAAVLRQRMVDKRAEHHDYGATARGPARSAQLVLARWARPTVTAGPRGTGRRPDMTRSGRCRRVRLAP